MDVAAWERKLADLKQRHRGGGRRALVALIILVAIIVIIRVALDPIATHYTRRALGEMDGFRGEFQRVHVTVLHPGYEITRLNIIEHPGGSWREPMFFAQRIHVGLDLRSLLRGDLVGRVRIERPKFSIIKPAKAKEEEKPKKEKAKPAPDLSAQLYKVAGMRVDRVEIVRGELLFRDMSQPRHPELWLHRLELAAENMATRPELAHGRPTTVAMHGTLGDSGDLSAFLSANPFASPLSFAGRLRLEGLRVAELYDLIEPATKMHAPEGTLDVFAEFVSKGGEITGGVKPVLKNVEVRPAEPGAWNRLKAWLADEALDIFSDRVPDRNGVATVVPIKGKLTDPDIQLWPTVLGVVRNAFVEGLTSGFTHLPPPTAEKKEGVLQQSKEALDDDQKGPPRAQPEGEEEKK